MRDMNVSRWDRARETETQAHTHRLHMSVIANECHFRRQNRVRLTGLHHFTICIQSTHTVKRTSSVHRVARAPPTQYTHIWQI